MPAITSMSNINTETIYRPFKALYYVNRCNSTPGFEVGRMQFFAPENGYVIRMYKSDNNFNFPPLGSFYPFSILLEIEILSEFEANPHILIGKKDNSEDK